MKVEKIIDVKHVLKADSFAGSHGYIQKRKRLSAISYKNKKIFLPDSEIECSNNKKFYIFKNAFFDKVINVGSGQTVIQKVLFSEKFTSLLVCYKNFIYCMSKLDGAVFDTEGKIIADTKDLKEKIITFILNYEYTKEKKYQEIKKQVAAYEKIVEIDEILSGQKSRRVAIPDDVRMFVWRRDEGQCVECKSNKNLEFDHIIPFSKGGGNSARNLQLLCEICNRKKSDKI